LTSAAAGTMGLNVVAHLARRHGIQVRLHPTGTGTVAVVELPRSTLALYAPALTARPSGRGDEEPAAPPPAAAPSAAGPRAAAPPVAGPRAAAPPVAGPRAAAPPVAVPPAVAAPAVAAPSPAPAGPQPVPGGPVPGGPPGGPPTTRRPIAVPVGVAASGGTPNAGAAPGDLPAEDGAPAAGAPGLARAGDGVTGQPRLAPVVTWFPAASRRDGGPPQSPVHAQSPMPPPAQVAPNPVRSGRTLQPFTVPSPETPVPGTDGGLPRRQPGAELAPATAPAGPRGRIDPEAIRARLASFAEGSAAAAARRRSTRDGS
jgi:hypothetical protein